MAERKWLVYKHTSPSGKVYIGITCRLPEIRWNKGLGYKSSPRFFLAIVKYGWDNFVHEILHLDLSENDAKLKEIELIKLYKSKRLSYNTTDGGDGVKGCIPTQFTRNKMSISAKNKPSVTLETRKKLSNQRKGKKKSDLWKQRIGIANKLNQAKPVLQFDKLNNYINEYPSILDAEKITKISNGHISKCCKGIRKSAGGFIWKYKQITN